MYCKVVTGVIGGSTLNYLGCFDDVISDGNPEYQYDNQTDQNLYHCLGFCLSEGSISSFI